MTWAHIVLELLVMLGRIWRKHVSILFFGMAAASLAAACDSAGDADDDSSEVDEGALINKSQEPMSKARLDSIIAAQHITSLDKLPAALPKDYLINVTLKHGRVFAGERGHLTETVVSQSSDPSAPRAVLWDERSGFTVSYNGGTQGQTEGNRLDVLEFDDAAKVFHFSGLEFNANTAVAAAPVYKTDPELEPSRKCARCHGESPRPIFGMYPDWPAFYGSDNDELTDTTKAVQERELHDFAAFRAAVSAQPAQMSRYAPLFDAANVKTQLRGTTLYPSYPYRQNIDTNIEAVSRSFAFRPSLRFGIVMNRLMAQVAANKIETHPNFEKFGALFLHDVLQCRWSTSAALQSSGWIDAVKTANEGAAPKTVASGRTMHYRDLLKIFDLTVNDIDIRYSHNHQGYANEDASTKPMEVGYVDGAFWNSYFDGSATIDELVAMHLYKKLQTDARFADIAGLINTPDGLVRKYSRRAERFKFDQNFFEEMDKKGTWIPIPYPKERLEAVQHREGYPSAFATQHAALCGKLETHIRTVASSGGTNNNGSSTSPVCPTGCVASTYCKDHPNAAQAIKVNGIPCMVQGAGGCQACR